MKHFYFFISVARRFRSDCISKYSFSMEMYGMNFTCDSLAMLLRLSIVLICVTNVKLNVEFCIFYCLSFETCKLILIHFFTSILLYFSSLSYFRIKNYLLGRGLRVSQPLVKFQSHVFDRGGKRLIFIGTHKNMRCVSYLIPPCYTVFLSIIYFSDIFSP